MVHRMFSWVVTCVRSSLYNHYNNKTKKTVYKPSKNFKDKSLKTNFFFAKKPRFFPALVATAKNALSLS